MGAPLVALMSVIAFSRIIESTTVGHVRDRLQVSSSNHNKRSVVSVIERDNGDVIMMCSDEKITEILSDLSSGCQNYLFDKESSYEFEEESRVLCQSCGVTLYSLLKCFNTSSTNLELYDVLCTENENGDTCYHVMSGDGIEEEDIISKCQDMSCSDACHDSLQNSFQQYGCCLYSLLALNTSMTMVHDMWSACGLEEPGMCNPAFSENKPPSLTTMETELNKIPTTSDTSVPSDDTSTLSSGTTALPNSATSPTETTTTESSHEPSAPNTEGIAQDKDNNPQTNPMVSTELNDRAQSGEDAYAQGSKGAATMMMSLTVGVTLFIAAFSYLHAD